MVEARKRCTFIMDKKETKQDCSSSITSPPTSATSSVPSSSVASLLHSAAKVSILNSSSDSKRSSNSYNNNKNNNRKSMNPDTTTTNVADNNSSNKKLFQDDEYDNLHETVHAVPSLQSLQKKKIPPIPDEQDRKRFLGCLAAVLAAQYEYELEPDKEEIIEDDGDEQRKKLENDQAEEQISSSFYQDEDDEEEVFFYHATESFDDSNHKLENSFSAAPATSATRPNSNNNSSNSSSTHSAPTPSRNNGVSLRLSSRQDKAAQLAQSRHRKRRYDVLSRFLSSAGELLNLDKSQGKCFLPMLSTLLIVPTPEEKKKRKKRFSVPDNISFVEKGKAYLEYQMDDIEYIRSFLEGLTPGSGLRCLSMLLSQYLLHSVQGYDARIRRAIKTVGVIVLLHDMLHDYIIEEQHGMKVVTPTDCTILENEKISSDALKSILQKRTYTSDMVTLATRKYESLEHIIAKQLIALSKVQRQIEIDNKHKHETGNQTKKSPGKLKSRESGWTNKDQFIRGLKIGGTAVAAGTLFAITGGMAAPGIAAGIAAIAGTTVVASAAALLTSTAAVTAIFGVGGGGLVAYKMQRRTIGLTEFLFNKELTDKGKGSSETDDDYDAELFSTICISGWLRDPCDFQRPWGITPTHPPIRKRLEKLERFYAVYKPGHIPRCRSILESWKGEELLLIELLRQKYDGADFEHLFPLRDGPLLQGALSHEEQELIDELFCELGYALPESKENRRRRMSPFDRITAKLRSKAGNKNEQSKESRSLFDSLHGPRAYSDFMEEATAEESPSPTRLLLDEKSERSQQFEESAMAQISETRIARWKHLATVWDYQVTYGGELYTVRWESNLLEELCDSVADLAADVVTGATTHLLKFTALSALVAAVALPVALKSAANMIDGTWTLVVERSDEAGRELAHSLLFSSAGNRPVTLVGYSFGARVIYSCLKELARYQEKWEEYREKLENDDHHAHHGRRRRHNSKKQEDQMDETEKMERMREPASIVEDVILMGLPNHLSLSSWRATRQVVAGRLVNCFSQKDLILSLMFQLKKFGLKPVCGTCPVNVAGVENVDVTDLISGHQDYCTFTGEILKRVRHGQPFRSRGPTFAVAQSVAIEFGQE